MAHNVTIERGIPSPTYYKYPFSELGVGDSFSVPLAGRRASGVKRDESARKLSNAASNYAARHNKQYGAGVKFTVRTDKEKGEARVWRVA